MRVRNIFIILLVQYLVLFVFSAFLELSSLSHKAAEVQKIITSAGDMALEQTQVMDDFMAYDDRDALELSMPSASGDGFIREDMFAGMLGLDSRVASNKEEIYNRLYNNNDLKMLTTRLNAIRKPVRYYNQTHTGMEWFYIPTAAFLGLDVLPPGQATKGIKDSYGNYVPDAKAQEIFAAYKLENHVLVSGGGEYYNTPLNIGLTYLNEDLLGTMFMNNVDLLMRQKYSKNLNTPAGGDGVYKGEIFGNALKGDLSAYHPINNGSFSVLRGTQNPTSSNVVSFSGVKPLVTYKVIDMYDRANDSMLSMLFGANKEGYSSKADYLKSLDDNVINPATNMPYTKKPIVVAKVTFYLDVIIPYSTWLVREMRANVSGDANNFIDLAPDGSSGPEGTRRVSYTRYFAVTP